MLIFAVSTSLVLIPNSREIATHNDPKPIDRKFSMLLPNVIVFSGASAISGG